MRHLAYEMIVMSLCMSLAVMPATALDFALEIFGNANMDDTIDELDIEYVQGIIDGVNDDTKLADANYDGEIDEKDIAQIKHIIEGTETDMTIIDSADTTVTVKKPVNSIVVCGSEPAVALRILDQMEKVIGVSDALITKDYSVVFLPEFQSLSTVGGRDCGWIVDYEAVLSLKPDVLITYAAMEVDDKKLPGVTVLHFDFYRARNTFKEMKTLGYVLDSKEGAQEYIDFCEPIIESISTKLETLPLDEITHVYLEAQGDYVTHTKMGAAGYQIELAGGQNIAANLIGGATGWLEVDPEWVLSENPDIIVKMAGWNRDDTSAGYETNDFQSINALRDSILNRPELANAKAVENGNVQLISYDITYTPDYIISVAYLAKLFYPQLFVDMDPAAVHQEYLDEFHKDLNWDVSREGTFVYPPISS